MSKVLRVNRRFENLAAAMEGAKRELHNHNRQTVTGTISMMGVPIGAAGLNIDITDLGALDGKYHTDAVVHEYSPGSGYTSEFTLRLGGPEGIMPKQARNAQGKKKQTSGIPDDGGDEI